MEQPLVNNLLPIFERKILCGMADDKLNIDSIIARLLEGKVNIAYFSTVEAQSSLPFPLIFEKDIENRCILLVVCNRILG